MQKHPVVQRLVDPGLKDLLDLRKVAHHSFFIESFGAQLDFHLAVVPVKIAAFAVIIQQPMAVAEMNFLRDPEHFQIIIDPCRTNPRFAFW